MFERSCALAALPVVLIGFRMDASGTKNNTHIVVSSEESFAGHVDATSVPSDISFVAVK